MDGKFILVIVCLTLAGVVVILAMIYAYIYFTQIHSPRRRSFTGSNRNNMRSRGHMICQSGATSGGDTQEDNKRLFQPFIILSYASRIRRDNEDK